MRILTCVAAFVLASLSTAANAQIFNISFTAFVTGTEFRTSCVGPTGCQTTLGIVHDQLPFQAALSGNFNDQGPVEIGDGQSVTLFDNLQAPNGYPFFQGTVTNNGGYLTGTNLSYFLQGCADGQLDGPCSDYIASAATFTVFGGIPEPGTWVMMLLGFGGMGLALRRRRKCAAIAQLA